VAVLFSSRGAQDQNFMNPTPQTAETNLPAPAEKPHAHGWLGSVRQWTDELVFVFLLVSFFQTFVLGRYKIPSSSMTPTLLGSEEKRYGDVDVDGDNERDLILRSGLYSYDVYLRANDRYHYAGLVDPGPDRKLWLDQLQKQQDGILVAKFSYWFSPPKRGNIVVFKTPAHIFERDKPVYIKRVVGLPGETLTFPHAPGVAGHENNMGYLAVNGERVTTPSFFKNQLYECWNMPLTIKDDRPHSGYATYADHGLRTDLLRVDVPPESVYVLGDNTVGSVDSRYWGKVALDRLRGRAFFRYNFCYFPYKKDPGFL
jgi:signal peptidase I